MNYDVIVIGAGPAGSACAIALGKAGKKVALIEKDAVGGVCLNRGCIPSKSYLYVAELLAKIRSAKRFGIEVGEPVISWSEIKKRKEINVKMLGTGLTNNIKNAGVEIMQGEAVFLNDHEIKVGEQVISAEKIVIAAGSEPLFLPTTPKSTNVVSTTEMLDLPELPKSMVMIGGGVSAVELASVFLEFGTQVTIIEREPALLAHLDREITTELKKALEKKGCEVLTEATVKSCTDTAEGATTIYTTKDGQEKTLQTKKALVAIGRTLNQTFLDALTKIGIKNNGRSIELNEYLQTSAPHIYVIGDAAFRNLTAYGGEREAQCVAAHIVGEQKTVHYEDIPVTIFSHPEVGAIGISEEEAKAKGIAYEVKKSSYAANAKALILNAREGMVKIIIEKGTQKILGVHCIGSSATELIHQALIPIMKGMPMKEWEAVVFSHPVLSEVFKAALQN